MFCAIRKESSWIGHVLQLVHEHETHLGSLPINGRGGPELFATAYVVSHLDLTHTAPYHWYCNRCRAKLCLNKSKSLN